MRRKLGLAFLYSVFGFLTYVLFLYLTFPSDAARDRLVYEANQAGIRMQLVGVRPVFPLGVTLEGVDIYRSNKGKRKSPTSDLLRPAVSPGFLDDEEPRTGAAKNQSNTKEDKEARGDADQEGTTAAEIPVVSVERVTINSLLPLVLPSSGTRGSVDFDADLYGGTATGSYAEDEETVTVSLAADDLDLSRYPVVGDDFDVRLTGKLGVNADLSINKRKIRDSNGNVSISLKDFALLKGSKIKGFDIPMTLAFRFSGGDADVKNGRVEFKNLKLESTPLTMEINGSIMLNKTLSRCRLNLKVALKFGDELAVAGAFLSSSAKSDDGYYHYIISGPLERLRHRPDRLAARKRGVNRNRGKNRPRVGGDDDGLPKPRGLSSVGRDHRRGRSPVLDDEERKRLREERRKRAEERRKRRQAMREARMRELEERRRLGPGVHGPGIVPEPDLLAPVPDVDVRYREFEDGQEGDVPPEVPEVEPGPDMEPGQEDLGPDLPQDMEPGEWEDQE